jgi:CRISPR-associated protein Cmr2
MNAELRTADAGGHLLLIALGPVQSFIAQARRTRDLWYGSHLLSELGRAAARRLLAGGAELIFPALDPGHPELEPCAQPLRNGKPPLSVANKLLAVVPSGVDPADLARATREAVQAFWRDDLAKPVRNGCQALLPSGVDGAWDEQIATFLEFTAVWTALAGTSYVDARRAVEKTLAARKNLRDFGPWHRLRGTVPKSSLDGERESVLLPRNTWDEAAAALARRYRIEEGEQLDAVGLVKRAGGEPGQFVPLVNVALASWIEVAAQHAPNELAQLHVACNAMRVAAVNRDLPVIRHFRFDASVLLPSRWRPVFDEQGLTGDPVAWGEAHVRPLLHRMSKPYPYVACLVADGDRMGQAIDRMGSPEEHRSLSQALSHFALQARTIVEQEHLGSLVYSGGDDVLAFLPLPTVLDCAQKLHDAFTECMRIAQLPNDVCPTLSVGIGVGHVMDGMAELLELGREAERLAKRGRRQEDQPRNALAVLVDLRSGGTRSWRGRWNTNPCGLLRTAIEVLDTNPPSRTHEDRAAPLPPSTERIPLPSGKVYEIGSILRRLPSPEEVGSEEMDWARVLAGEVRRSLARARSEGEGGQKSGVDPKTVGLELESAGSSYSALHRCVSEWVERMLVARTLAAARPEPRLSKPEGNHEEGGA